MTDKDCNFEIGETGRRALISCPECGKENYAFNVLSGICSWCKYDINKDDKYNDRLL